MGLVRVLALRSPPEALGVGSLLQTLDEVVEARARDAVRRLCLMALKQLPTSLAHDMRLVHGPHAHAHRLYMCPHTAYYCIFSSLILLCD